MKLASKLKRRPPQTADTLAPASDRAPISVHPLRRIPPHQWPAVSHLSPGSALRQPFERILICLPVLHVAGNEGEDTRCGNSSRFFCLGQQ